MSTNPYIVDILSQPEALNALLAAFSPADLDPLARLIQAGSFERILITGMGGSFFGAYPAWLQLSAHGLPVWLLETSELLHYSFPLITPRSLVWVISQSGSSAEVRTLLQRLQDTPHAFLLATTNDQDSSLANAAHLVHLLHSGPEATVSTRSYLNTLAATRLAASRFTGGDFRQELSELQRTAAAIAAYLETWEHRVEHLVDRVGLPERLVILGRGPSLAAAQTAALIQKEAAKYMAEGMSSAQFRHGPLELADPRLVVCMLAGLPHTRRLNESLAQAIMDHGARLFWLDHQEHPHFPTLLQPSAPAAGLPLVEILPFQMLSIALARQAGVEPGIFQHIGKVVLEE